MSRLAIRIDPKAYLEYPTEGAPKDFKDFIEGFLQWQSDLVIERIQEVVRQKLYNWEPLSPGWQNFKEKMGLDPRHWLASGQLLESVQVFYFMNGWYIGVHPRKKHRGYKGNRKGARLIDILRWLEAGTTKMPPRPLFTKVFSEFRPKKVQQELYSKYLTLRKGVI